jgi:hypothetical protein
MFTKRQRPKLRSIKAVFRRENRNTDISADLIEGLIPIRYVDVVALGVRPA